MRSTVANWAALVLLVPALTAFGWIASEELRLQWRTEPHEAVGPGPDGWAQIDRTRVRIASFEELHVVTDDVEQWEPPQGYTVWQVTIDVESELPEETTCDVRLFDDDGNAYTAPGAGVELPVSAWGTLTCGGPADDPTYSTMFLLPESARPTALELSSAFGAYSHSPEYFRLPVS
ncbi:hypothetical protein [Georgenia alba]|uniref:DUF4352 domain-containing protein n=1 Tax=Georgenia alba TaxID=2233858 RepID=A0ABW2Q7D7_9MICO